MWDGFNKLREQLLIQLFAERVPRFLETGEHPIVMWWQGKQFGRYRVAPYWDDVQ